MSRPRSLGIPFLGEPGPLNAITDVPGLEVGYCTLIEGDNVRTGVTAILPRGKESTDSCFAGIYALNGNGEMTGSHWIEESGFLDGPVMITNTHSVGVVRDAVIAWFKEHRRFPDVNRFGEYGFTLPIVAETADLRLNDMNGFFVRPEHAFAALDAASGGPVAEGNVGGGTGMICHGWKGGTGTSSRAVGDYTVGVLVQANHGNPKRLTIAGVPVGISLPDPSTLWGRGAGVRAPETPPPGTGSIIVIVATDAPLLPHQLKRLARRVPLGIGRVGGLGENSSGDIFLAFSTANQGVANAKEEVGLEMIPNALINPFFEAVVDATEEAIINVLFAAETMTGNGVTVRELPRDEVRGLVVSRLSN
jgi:D-aminopeptidase